jgi:hypothetical protein
MNRLSFWALALLFSCQQQADESENTEDHSVSSVITNDTIPKQRTSPKKAAVASFTEQVPDEFNEWLFTVAAYETGDTFKYRLTMQYKAFETESLIDIPDFGTYPTVEIRKGEKNFTAIVGFLGKEGNFKPYKRVEAEGNKLKLTTIQNYQRGVVVRKRKSS